MQNIRKLFLFVFLLSGMLTLQACDSNKGPLEEAGEDLDEVVEDIGDSLEEACENVTDSNCD